MIKGFRITFEGMLRGGVKGREWCGYQAKDRTYIDDPSRLLLSHDREDRVGRADHSEKVYVEQRLGLVHRRFFSPGKQAGPRVVHQNVDPARHIEHLVDGCLHRCVICHVAGDHRNPLERTRDGTPAGAEHSESSLVQRLCRGLPDSCRSPGHNRHFTVSSHKSLLDGIDQRRASERCKPPCDDNFVTELFLNTSSPVCPTA